MPQTIRVGGHVVHIEPPLVLLEIHGQMREVDHDQIYDCLQRAITDQGVAYLVADITNLPTPSPALRRHYSERPHSKLPLRAILLYGGSPILMAVVQLVRRGMDLLPRSGRSAPVIACRSEAEARAWVKEDLRGSA